MKTYPCESVTVVWRYIYDEYLYSAFSNHCYMIDTRILNISILSSNDTYLLLTFYGRITHHYVVEYLSLLHLSFCVSNWGNISWWFMRNSKAFSSEFLGNHQEIFPYYNHLQRFEPLGTGSFDDKFSTHLFMIHSLYYQWWGNDF